MHKLRYVALCLLFACGSDDDAVGAKSDGKSTEAPDAPQGSGGTAGGEAPKLEQYPDPRGACDIHSGYPDDRACLLPPAPGEGMQIHIGPSNYDDPDEVAKYVLHPGEETSQCWTFHTPNDEPIYYQTFVLSGRAGTHHIINTMHSADLEDGGFGGCLDGGTGMSSSTLGSLPGASKPYMPRGHVAPENKHIGHKVPAHVTAQADMHYFNYSDNDIIREFWLNVYFVDAKEITGEATLIRGMGGFMWNNNPIPPGTDMVYNYQCPIKGDGRIIALLGHYHSHGRRFAATLKRGDDDPMKVFEMYDYMEPATFEYNTLIKNPGFSANAPGALTGVLEVHDGDVLGWECHIVNDSNVGLRYINEVKTGEMCNLWGESFGIEAFNCYMP